MWEGVKGRDCEFEEKREEDNGKQIDFRVEISNHNIVYTKLCSNRIPKKKGKRVPKEVKKEKKTEKSEELCKLDLDDALLLSLTGRLPREAA